MDTAASQSSSNLARVGRQPILGREHQLLAYELLFRGSSTATESGAEVGVFDGDKATSTVLANTLLEIGINRVVGDKLAFVNFTRKYLTGELTIPFQPDRIVVEILEDIEMDDEVIAGLWRLSDQGFKIALDDFVYSPTWDPALEVADIVKVDVFPMTPIEVFEHTVLLQDYNVVMLAEKVETYESYKHCLDLGFEMFQGYYFAKPNLVEVQTNSASQSTLLTTISAVSDPETETEEVAAAVSQDVNLVHKLLRYVNSSAVGLNTRVDSVQQTIVYLGKEQVKGIATLLLMNSIDDKPAALMRSALLRGKACELYAKAAGLASPDRYFTVGLLSMLDALLNRSLTEVFEELPISKEIRDAILEHHGPMGECLATMIAIESCDTPAEMPTSELVMACEQAYSEATLATESGEGMADLLPRDTSKVNVGTLCVREKMRPELA